jgi:hypothetical protein
VFQTSVDRQRSDQSFSGALPVIHAMKLCHRPTDTEMEKRHPTGVGSPLDRSQRGDHGLGAHFTWKSHPLPTKYGIIVGVRDNVDIPYRDPKTKKPGEVKVKIPFTNPVIVGKFPYHCHILEHEDGA